MNISEYTREGNKRTPTPALLEELLFFLPGRDSALCGCSKSDTFQLFCPRERRKKDCQRKLPCFFAAAAGSLAF